MGGVSTELCVCLCVKERQIQRDRERQTDRIEMLGWSGVVSEKDSSLKVCHPPFL